MLENADLHPVAVEDFILEPRANRPRDFRLPPTGRREAEPAEMRGRLGGFGGEFADERLALRADALEDLEHPFLLVEPTDQIVRLIELGEAVEVALQGGLMLGERGDRKSTRL